MSKMQTRKKHSQHLGTWKEWNAGELPNPLFLNVPYSLKQDESCHISLKAHWPQKALELTAHEREAAHHRLKDCLAQETWALPSYHLLNPRIGCASIRILRQRIHWNRMLQVAPRLGHPKVPGPKGPQEATSADAQHSVNSLRHQHFLIGLPRPVGPDFWLRLFGHCVVIWLDRLIVW